MKKRKTKWWVLISLIILAVGAISLYIYINVKRQWDDPYPPKDDDLILEWPDIPDEENAYSYLNELKLKAVPMSTAEDDRVYLMTKGEEEWDHEFVEKVLIKNKAGFDIAEKMLRCNIYLPPKPSIYSFNIPVLNPLRETIRQWYYQALSLLAQGKHKQAFDIAIKILKIGHLLESAQGGITNYLSGYAVKAMGFGIFRKGTAIPTIKSEILMEYIAELEKYGPSEAGIANSMKAEYIYACLIVDEIASGRFSIHGFNSQYRFYPKQLKPGKLFQPNNTKKMLAETFRQLIVNLEEYYINMDIPEDLPGIGSMLDDVPIRDRIPIGANKVGRIIHDWHTSLFYRILNLKCRESSEVNMTRLLMVLKCYKLDHGNLPDSLDELVPKYIDKIPIDDFDGKPLRYSKKKKIIYSVGPDLEDSGGRREMDKDKSSPPEKEVLIHDDQVFKIEF